MNDNNSATYTGVLLSKQLLNQLQTSYDNNINNSNKHGYQDTTWLWAKDH